MVSYKLKIFPSYKSVKEFLDIANQEIHKSFIVSWKSIVINPLAITCRGEYLSKDNCLVMP